MTIEWISVTGTVGTCASDYKLYSAGMEIHPKPLQTRSFAAYVRAHLPGLCRLDQFQCAQGRMDVDNPQRRLHGIRPVHPDDDCIAESTDEDRHRKT